MRFIIRLLINAAALWVAARLIPGITYEGGGLALIFVALVFGVLNAIVRPILALITCPFQILTLGLFTLVLNAVMLLLTSGLSRALGLDFHVAGFWPALLGGLIISLVSILLSVFVREENERD